MSAAGKDHARINLGIWGDDDFRNLTPPEQHLYFALWTSPSLSYCGTGTWHAGRISQLADGWTREHVEQAAAGLARKLFLIVDADTDEFLLRSWIKHDGLWRTPNMAVSIANARAAVASKTLRGIVVHEVLKVRENHAESKAWERAAVVSMLDQAPIDPASVEPFNPASKGASNPGARGAAKGSAKGDANPDANPWGHYGAKGGPTQANAQATTTTTKTFSDEADAQTPDSALTRATKKGCRLPDDWMPDPAVVDAMRAQHPGVDLEAEHAKFCDYWRAKSGQAATKLDWNATWRNWIRNARPSTDVHRDPMRSGWDQLKDDTRQLGA